MARFSAGIVCGSAPEHAVFLRTRVFELPDVAPRILVRRGRPRRARARQRRNQKSHV